MSKKLRVIVASDAMWSPSGYGQQAAEFVPRIKKEGYDIAYIDTYGLSGGIIELDGIRHYPSMRHIYGSDAMVHHSRDFKSDVVISFKDVWSYAEQDIKQIQRWVPYVPIDHDPVPPAVLAMLKHAYRIVTYSEFGHKQLLNLGIHSTLIPHGVDTSVFTPKDKKEARKWIGVPEDAYLIGMVAANRDNPSRKSFQEALDGFKLFLDKEPKARLYLHTDPRAPEGFPVISYAQHIGLGDRLTFPNVYQYMYKFQKEDMARIYSTMDVLLMPSTSEGFGVPAIEAQSCGVPVVLNDCSSMPELIEVGKTGQLCVSTHKRWDGLNSYVHIPSPQSICHALERVRKMDKELTAKACRERMTQKYDIDKIYRDKWSPFLVKLEDEIYSG